MYMHFSREVFIAIFRSSEGIVNFRMFKKLCCTKWGKSFEKVVGCKKRIKTSKQ